MTFEEKLREEAETLYHRSFALAKLNLIDLMVVFALQQRQQVWEEAAKLVESTHVVHGDHNTTYSAPSINAEELAIVIRARAVEELKQ